MVRSGEGDHGLGDQKLLRAPRLKAVRSDDPAEILIFPFNKAQILAYRRVLEQLSQKLLTTEDLARRASFRSPSSHRWAHPSTPAPPAGSRVN